MYLIIEANLKFIPLKTTNIQIQCRASTVIAKDIKIINII